MNGIMSKLVYTACLGGLALAGGCMRYQRLVDPCYPDRYNYMARQEVHAAFCPQVRNGHALDQTVWNYHFEQDENGIGTDRLTPIGIEHLAYLSRKRPSPDTTIFLQTAYDVAYDGAKPEEFTQKRAEMDRNRVAAIQKYLTAQTAARPLPFEVVVHDPKVPYLMGEAARNAVIIPRGYYFGHVGISSVAPIPQQTGGLSANIGGR
jgi:hypothetical protein